jgi:hypothetical protein
MKIKTLLGTSAACMIGAANAFAADAVVVAEPEAVEYVRVCDAYGEGFFYIPGTEPCLKIGGYVRYDIGGGKLLGLDTDGDGLGDAFNKAARFDFQVSTSSETDYGTLSTYAEVAITYGDQRDDTTVEINPVTGTSTELFYAYIDFAGLRVGLDDSVFSQFTGYAGNVINDDLIGYGPFETTLISYTFDQGNGFSAVVSLEDDAGAGDGYVPNVVAGAKYTAGDFGISGVVAYDESIKKAAGKLRVDGKVGNVTLFAMGGYGSVITEIDPVTLLPVEVDQRYKNWGGKWALWGGASVALGEKATLNGQLSYDAAKNFAAVGNVEYEVAPGFAVTSELGYYDTEADKGIVGGQLRFKRSF